MAKDPTCVQECNSRMRDKVKICDYEFGNSLSPYYQNTSWHAECLAIARNEFDACIAMCPDVPENDAAVA